ncbi:MAG: LTA synthase family protein [Oscillospiraceae bacterium]|nr:LTA synthase family protein [Oscillospiraceae bacterium]
MTGKQGKLRNFAKNTWNRENAKYLLEFFVVSLFINFLIELFSRRSLGDALQFMTKEPFLFMLGTLIILFTLSFSLLTKKRGFWFFFIALIWVGIGIADFVQRSYRSMPITASDIFLMSSVKDIFELYMSYFQLVLIMLGISVLLGGLVYIWVMVKKHRSVLAFGISTVLFLGATLALSIFLLLRSGDLGHTSSFHSLPRAYRNNGFVYCFSASLVTRGVDEPEDYSSERVEDLLDDTEKELPETADNTPNMIFVQLESFFDPKYMKDLTLEYDPVPNFTYLKEHYSTGLLSVPAIGAGTANTEFEVLSGMNLSHFGVGEYPYMTIVDSASSESICHALGSIGYSTHAIHNNNATFYDRHIVYDNLGFDTYTSLEYMDHVEYNPRGWCDDSVLTAEIEKCLTSTEGRDLVFTVSVQPHGKYPTEPLDGVPVIDIQGMEDPGRENGFEYFLYQLYQCDAFLMELITCLEAYEEPIALVLYGDHLPSFNIEDHELSVGDSQTTEYVIWTNYTSPRQQKDLQTYQLSAYVLDYCKIYEGEVFRLHQSYGYASDNDEAYQEDLQLLEYDIVSGDRFYDEDQQSSIHTPMRFDVEDISISDVSFDPEQGSCTIYGQHFTAHSAVYINETLYQPEYCSDGQLILYDYEPTAGDQITVAQISASSEMEILSVCEPFILTVVPDPVSLTDPT